MATLSPAEVYALAAGRGLDHERAVTATAIAWAESGLRADAVGDVDLEDDTWGPSMGLWQIRSLRADTGTGRVRDVERLGEPAFNAAAMVAISAAGTDWTPWSAWKNGWYRTHTAAVRAAVKETPVPTPESIILDAMAEMQEAGHEVSFSDGWEARGRPTPFAPEGLVIHHTATSRWAAGDYPSLGIVRDGRPDLAGPLAQFGLGRSGRIYVIAAGTANHAGPGGWAGLAGNSTVWGIEAESDGIGEPWPPAQITAYLALAAALCRHSGFGPSMIACHREWSAYKIDPTGIDGDWFRSRVADLLAAEPEPAPEPVPTPTQEAPSLFIFDGPDGGIWFTDGATWKRGVPNANALLPWRLGHVPHLGALERDYFDALPVFADIGEGDALAGPLAQYAEPLSCAGAG